MKLEHIYFSKFFAVCGLSVTSSKAFLYMFGRYNSRVQTNISKSHLVLTTPGSDKI